MSIVQERIQENERQLTSTVKVWRTWKTVAGDTWTISIVRWAA